MSSHHIVREKQEPALLIASLGNFHPENLGQLLEWSPTVIVTEDIYEHADSMGIKIDAVITSNPDFSSQESTHLIFTETNPLEDGLKYLVGEQYPSVNVIVKEFVLLDYVLFAESIDLVIYTDNKKIFPVRSGFSKWRALGEQLFFLQEVVSLKTSGLIFLTDHVAEMEKDGFYSLTFDQPFIFIAEEI
ncbi:MAG: thiamine pyrophosphokinae [Sphingobacteriaceae bacterium]|jgi:thiamine pyrophosphokinase|nr:thiamine pyrophosphokinae [Sphingobacteriaceae bacterium]